MILFFVISILFVLINAQRNELLNKKGVKNGELYSTIKIFNSTPLIERKIKSTHKNIIIVTPYQNPIQNSYLQETLRRLRTEKSPKILFTQAGLINSAAKIQSNRVIVRPQVRFTNAKRNEKTKLFNELEAKDKRLNNSQKKNYRIDNVPKSYAVKLVPGIKVKSIDSDQLEKIKITEAIKKMSETMTPLNELEIKSDFYLQKALYRTTMRTSKYKLPKLETSTSLTYTNNFVNNINQSKKKTNIISNNINPLQTQTVGLQSSQNITSNQFEQLGCGFDIITQTCKDLFQIGWCQHCTDFGNVFLHDCKCTAVSALYINSLASVASPRTNIGSNFNQTEQQTGQISNVFIPILFNNLPTYQSSQLQQQKTVQQSNQPIIILPAPFIMHSQNFNQSELYTEKQNPQKQQQQQQQQRNAAFNFYNQKFFNRAQRSFINK